MREGHLTSKKEEEEEEEEEEEPKEKDEGEDDAGDEIGEGMVLKYTNGTSSINSHRFQEK
jgi:hypothetical protein